MGDMRYYIDTIALHSLHYREYPHYYICTLPYELYLEITVLLLGYRRLPLYELKMRS
jgi:hypothetical protein